MNYSERPVSNTKLNSQPVNISECADVTVQALKILGLDIAKDADYLTEFYKEKYNLLLDEQPRSGEPFAQLQLDNDFRLRTMLDKIDNQTYNNKKYQRFSVWYKAPWTNNPKNENFFHKNIRRRDANNASLRHLTGQARLALNDGKNPMEPVIFFADIPFDAENVNDDDKDKSTQLGLLSIEKAKYELENPQFNLQALDVASYAMLALQRRIRGVEMPITFGTMIIPDLGRKKSFGGTAISIVHSSVSGQLGLGWSRGNPSNLTGFGISIGHK